MLCCCERDEQTASRIMSDYNIDLGEWVVSSVPSLMAKIVDLDELGLVISILDVVHLLLVFVLVPCNVPLSFVLRGVGMILEVVRPGRGSGGVIPSGDPRGRAPGGGQGAKPPGSQRFLKI